MVLDGLRPFLGGGSYGFHTREGIDLEGGTKTIFTNILMYTDLSKSDPDFLGLKCKLDRFCILLDHTHYRSDQVL